MFGIESMIVGLFLSLCLLGAFPRDATDWYCCGCWLLVNLLSVCLFIWAGISSRQLLSFLPVIVVGLLVAYQQYTLLRMRPGEKR